MKVEIMKNKFELFEQVRNSQSLPFPFDESELYDLVENIEPKDSHKEVKFFEPVKANIFKKLMQSKKGVIMSGIISLLIVSILSVFSLQNSDQIEMNTNLRTNKKMPVITSDNIADNFENSIPNKKSEISYTDTINYSDEVKDKTINQSNVLTMIRQSDINNLEIPFFIFSKNELNKLGIIFKSNGIQITTETQYTLNENPKSQEYLDLNYPKEGIARKNINIGFDGKIVSENLKKYTGWDKNKSTGSFPISYYSFCSNPNNNNFARFSSPILSNEIEKLYPVEISQFSKYLLEMMEKVIDIYTHPTNDKGYQLIIETNWKSYPLIKHFIPIYVNLNAFNEGNEKKSNTSLLIWLPNTKNNLLLLPKPYTDFYGQYATSDSVITSDTETLELANKMNRLELLNQSNNKDITQFERINLSTDELEKIGIKLQNNKYQVMFESKIINKDLKPEMKTYLSTMNYDTSLSKLNLRSINLVDTSEITQNLLTYSGWDNVNFSKTIPVCISIMNILQAKHSVNNFYKYVINISDYSPLLDSINDKWNLIEFESDTSKAKIDRLIPVRINLGVKKDTLKMAENEKNNYSEVDIWFYANKEIVELMPERYKERLLKELELITSIEDGLITTEQACEILKGESFFDFCGKSNETLKKLSVFPNPLINKELVIKFDLIQDSEISIKLYDLEGNLIQNLLEKSSFTKGNFSRTFNLNVSNGIYLIDIKTNSGSIYSKIMKY